MPSSALDMLPHPPFPAQQGQYWIDALSDGSHVLIRPLRPQDRQREKAFIENLSPSPGTSASWARSRKWATNCSIS